MLETVYTVMLVFQSPGIFFNVHLKRLAILSKPTSPDAKNIFVTTPDDSKVLPFHFGWGRFHILFFHLWLRP